MKKIAVLFSLIIFLSFLTAFGLGLYSRIGHAPGLKNGQLMPCPSFPNCVSSKSAPTNSHAIAAIEWTPEMGNAPLLIISKAIKKTQGEIRFTTEDYLAATFRSSLFGFFDDIEFQVDYASRLIHVRAASRIGYSDFGMNRKRVEQLRQLIHELSRSSFA